MHRKFYIELQKLCRLFRMYSEKIVKAFFFVPLLYYCFEERVESKGATGYHEINGCSFLWNENNLKVIMPIEWWIIHMRTIIIFPTKNVGSF